MKKLIVSYDTYSWVRNCFGLILQEPTDFIVLIVTKDLSPMIECPILCKEAVVAQRHYDLFKIGKRLGIKKLQNLMYCSENGLLAPSDIQKLSAQLQLQIIMGGVEEVYYQGNSVLDSIFSALRKSTTEAFDIFKYNATSEEATNIVNLSPPNHKLKADTTKLIVGANSKEDFSMFLNIEFFKKI